MNNENQNEEILTFSFPMEDGNELECEVITTLSVAGKSYVALLPLSGPEAEDGDVFLYRYIETEGKDPEIMDITDDDEFDKVSDAFEEFLDTVEFDELIKEDPENEND